MLRDFGREEQGATAIEYGLIAALIALAILGGVSSLGNVVEIMWLDNSSRIVQHLN